MYEGSSCRVPGLAIWWANRPTPVAVVLHDIDIDIDIDRGKVELTVANTRAGEVKAYMRTCLSTIVGGRIEVLAVKEGDLIDDTCLYVTAPLDEVDASKICAGQPVRISLDAFAKQSFAGKVRRVAPYVSAVEKQARTVELEASLD